MLRFRPIALSSVVCLFLAGCSSKSAAPPPPSPDAWEVVDGREIRREQVEKAYRRTVDPATKPSDEEATTAKLMVLNDLVLQDILLAKAKGLGIEVTGADIEKAFNDRKQSTPDDVFAKQLA